MNIYRRVVLFEFLFAWQPNGQLCFYNYVFTKKVMCWHKNQSNRKKKNIM